jgi:hypothetical protein
MLTVRFPVTWLGVGWEWSPPPQCRQCVSYLTLIPLGPWGGHIVLTVTRCQIAQQIIKYKKLKTMSNPKLFVFFLSCFRHFIWNSFSIWFFRWNNLTSQKTWAICCHREPDKMPYFWKTEDVMDLSTSLWAYSCHSQSPCLTLAAPG